MLPHVVPPNMVMDQDYQDSPLTIESHIEMSTVGACYS